MSMTVTKQLGGIQDLLLGNSQETEQQIRGNKAADITKIDIPLIIDTIEGFDLTTVDTDKHRTIEFLGYKEKGIGGGLFQYDATDTTTEASLGEVLVSGTKRFKRLHKAVSYVANRAELRSLVGYTGQEVTQQDIGLSYTWSNDTIVDDKVINISVGSGGWIANNVTEIDLKYAEISTENTTDDIQYVIDTFSAIYPIVISKSYELSSRLDIPSNTQIVGRKGNNLLGSTTIFQLDGKDNVDISGINFELTSNLTAEGSCLVDTCSNIKIEDCSFSNSGLNNNTVSSLVILDSEDNIVVKDNGFEYCDKSSIYIEASKVKIIDNTIRGSGQYGIYLDEDSNECLVITNSISETGYSAIYSRSSRCNISNNICGNSNQENSFYSNINILGADNSISNNILLDTQSTKTAHYGIELGSGSSNNSMIDNIINGFLYADIRNLDNTNSIQSISRTEHYFSGSPEFSCPGAFKWSTATDNGMVLAQFSLQPYSSSVPMSIGTHSFRWYRAYFNENVYSALSPTDDEHLTRKDYVDAEVDTRVRNDELDGKTLELLQGAVGGVNNTLLDLPLRNNLKAKVGTDAELLRSTSATFVNMYDELETVGVNSERYTKDGILTEVSSTNLLTRSNELTHADWFKGKSTINDSTNDSIEPSVTSFVFRETTDDGEHHAQQTIDVLEGETYTFSAYFHKDQVSSDRLIIIRLSGVAVVNAKYSSTTDAIVYGTGVLIKYDNGFRRISITETATNDGSMYVRTQTSLSDGSISFVGETDKGFDIDHIQLEKYNYATSYIDTVDTSVTRGNDNLRVLRKNYFPSWSKPFTIVAEFKPRLGSGTNNMLFADNIATGNGFLNITATDGLVFKVLGSVSYPEILLTSEDKIKVVCTSDGINTAMYIDNVLVGNGTVGTSTEIWADYIKLARYPTNSSQEYFKIYDYVLSPDKIALI